MKSAGVPVTPNAGPAPGGGPGIAGRPAVTHGTSAVIAAARGTGMIAARAHAILDEPARTCVTSDYVRMEIFPNALYEQQQQKVLLYAMFCARAVHIVPSSAFLMPQAYTAACTFGFAAMDAFYTAAAQWSGAEE